MRKLGNLFSIIVAFLIRLTPWKLNYYLAQTLAFLWYDVFKIRKKVILENINKALPGLPKERQDEIAKNSMVSLCRSFFDVMRIPYLTNEWIDKNVIFEGSQSVEQIKNSDSGIFFLSLHLGSGDLAAAIVSRKLKPVTLITKRFSNQFLDAFWFGLRGRAETKFINAHGKKNAFEILSALKNKQGVAFVLDQFMGKPYGVESQFFGVTTGTAYGLALFWKKTQKPVFPLYTYWDDQQKFHICIDQPVDLTADLSETNEVITNKFNRILEDIIKRHPDHWMWVHKRWKTFE